jgi:phenylpyruvate tautomerase PptA (4-oxalocrotonate tautomerase family)
MDMINRSNEDVELPETTGGLSRRAALMTAAGAVAGVSAVLADAVSADTGSADAVSAASFGAPVVELNVPAGVLTLEQKSAMIKGVTDVVLNATKLAPDQARKLWVQIFETAEGGWGFGGQVFVPRAK